MHRTSLTLLDTFWRFLKFWSIFWYFLEFMDASGFACVQVMCKYVYIQGCVVGSVFSRIFGNFGSISALKWTFWENQWFNAHETCSRHSQDCVWHLCLVRIPAGPCISLNSWTRLTVQKSKCSKFKSELIFLLSLTCWTCTCVQNSKNPCNSWTRLTFPVVLTNLEKNP